MKMSETNQKEIVVPGEMIGEGIDLIPGSGVIRDGQKLVSTIVGFKSLSGRALKVIPLGGVYIPKEDDIVIGEIIDVSFSSWSVDMGGPYLANITVSEAVGEYVDLQRTDISKYYDIGDKIVARIKDISASKSILLTMKGPGLRKLEGGYITRISPSKVPRLIGREGSMIKMIKDLTNTAITVGQNGLVWVKGRTREDELRAAEAVDFINKNSHTEGLTERINEMLGDKNVQKKV
jgi:exosome complex component RRP4